MFSNSVDPITVLFANRLYTWLSYAITRVRTSATIYDSKCSIIDCSVESSTTVRVTILVSYVIGIYREVGTNLAPPLALLK